MIKFIAEVSSNHHRSLDRCLAFIDKAAEIGCYGVKFQLFKIELLFAKEILQRSEAHRQRQRWELPLEFLPALAERCRYHNIKLGCTPFYLDAVDELLPFVDFFKIASYELLWHELIEKCIRTGKPIVISTGMANLAEIDTVVQKINKITTDQKADKSNISFLHCVSGYPVPAVQCNLAAIRTIRQATGFTVGWSDHSVCPAVIYRAIYAWMAETIEFHLDLDQQGDEFNAGHCWLPHQIADVITTVQTGFDSDGTGKKQPLPVELPDRDWRTDPIDGLRPMISLRQKWSPKETSVQCKFEVK